MGSTARPAVPAPSLLGGRAEGFALLLVTACSWGLNWPVMKFILEQVPPFTARTVAGWPRAGLRDRTRARRARSGSGCRAGQVGLLLVYATLNFGAFTIFTTISLVWLRASEAVVITYTLPIWAALLAWPMLGERPDGGAGPWAWCSPLAAWRCWSGLIR